MRELSEEVFDEGGLPDSRFAHHGDDPALTVADLVVCLAQLLAFCFAADRTALGQCDRASGANAAAITSSNERELLFHFTGGGTDVWILRQHPVHQALQSRRHRWSQLTEKNRLVHQNRNEHRGHRWRREG